MPSISTAQSTGQLFYDILYLGAFVGQEQTFFLVMENLGVVELCINVLYPVIDCPIAVPFYVILSTDDETAGG